MGRAEKTDRLLLRAPSAGDLGCYLKLFRDPAVEGWLRPPPLKPFRDSDVRAMLADDEEHWARYDFGPWAILEREESELVGRAGLRWTEIDGRLAIELPWAIRSDRWGRGYATEAVAAAIDWARSLEIEEVVALVRPENAASRRVGEKVGMQAAGETVHEGLDHLVYRLRLSL